MKKTLIWILVLVLLAVGGYWLYDRYVQGPEYSLYQIKKAVDARDMVMLEKYVDVDRTTASLMDQTVQAGLEQLSEKDRAMAAMFLGMAMASQKDQILQALREEVERYVQNGEAGQAPPAGLSPQEWEQAKALLPLEKLLKDSPITKAKLEGISYVNRQDTVATVGLELSVPNQPEPIIVDVRMRDQEDYWQVIGLPNAGDVLQKLGLLDAWKKSQSMPKLKLRL